MNEQNRPPKDENPLLDTLREEVAGGLRYTHTRANANTRKLLEIASFAYAAIITAATSTRMVLSLQGRGTLLNGGNTLVLQ